MTIRELLELIGNLIQLLIAMVVYGITYLYEAALNMPAVYLLWGVLAVFALGGVLAVKEFVDSSRSRPCGNACESPSSRGRFWRSSLASS